MAVVGSAFACNNVVGVCRRSFVPSIFVQIKRMIDLAPTNPYGLLLRSAVIVAPGCAGAGLPRALDPTIIGAIATRPTTLHTVRPPSLRWSATPAGVMFEQLPSVRLRSQVQSEARRWQRSSVPVLLSLRGLIDELVEMVVQLEGVEGISGLLIEVSEPEAAQDPTGIAISGLRAQTPLPLLPLLPYSSAIEQSAQNCVAAGADALVLCAYPTTTGMAQGEIFEGVLVGPALAPWTLHALAQVRRSVDVPLVALGGVADVAAAQKFLAAGATALLVDGALYGDPFAPQRIGAELQRNNASTAASA